MSECRTIPYLIEGLCSILLRIAYHPPKCIDLFHQTALLVRVIYKYVTLTKLNIGQLVTFSPIAFVDATMLERCSSQAVLMSVFKVSFVYHS